MLYRFIGYREYRVLGSGVQGLEGFISEGFRGSCMTQQASEWHQGLGVC